MTVKRGASASVKGRVGVPPSPEVMFAFRMLMIKYHLKPTDVLKIMVALEKEGC